MPVNKSNTSHLTRLSALVVEWLPEGEEAESAAMPRGVTAGEDELARNPRARSARLRQATRTAAPALGLDENIARLARLPARQERRR